MEMGVLSEGDHICYSADDPFANVALHYLTHIAQCPFSLLHIATVFELANIPEHAVIVCQGKVLQNGHISGLDSAIIESEEFPTLEEMERRHILAALEKTGGVLAGPKGAVALLNMHRSTLWARMQKLGISVSGKQ